MSQAPPTDDCLDKWLARLWALGLIVLLLSTWRLWTPLRWPPRVPALSWLTGLPAAVDYLLLVLLAWAALRALISPSRRPLLVAAGSLALLMAVDQLRWQAWAFHLLVMAPAIALSPPTRARRWLGWFTISIYLFAAAAKLDAVFMNTMGQQLVDALAGLVGLDGGQLPATVRSAAALAMPLGEAAIGLLLIFSLTRRLAVSAAIALHALVAIALSPLGLGHELGVILWNIFFAALVWRLFWPQSAQLDTSQESAPTPSSRKTVTRSATERLAIGVLAVAMLAPLTQPLEMWDRWPSWGLYAPRGERAVVFVHASAADRLPEDLPLDDTSEGDRWRRVRLDDWLLEETGAPLYPQNRTTLALALALDEKARLGGYLKVEVQSAADRFSGDRTGQTLLGADAVRTYCQENYWLNTKPRWTR